MSDDTHTHHADAGHLVASLRRMRAHLSRYLARPPDHPAPQGPEDPADLARRYGQPISHLRRYISDISALCDDPALVELDNMGREIRFSEPDPERVQYWEPAPDTYDPAPYDPQGDTEHDSH
jgi:hypothetical protein